MTCECPGHVRSLCMLWQGWMIAKVNANEIAIVSNTTHTLHSKLWRVLIFLQPDTAPPSHVLSLQNTIPFQSLPLRSSDKYDHSIVEIKMVFAQSNSFAFFSPSVVHTDKHYQHGSIPASRQLHPRAPHIQKEVGNENIRSSSTIHLHPPCVCQKRNRCRK